jgi:hypothetical protein
LQVEKHPCNYISTILKWAIKIRQGRNSYKMIRRDEKGFQEDCNKDFSGGKGVREDAVTG